MAPTLIDGPRLTPPGGAKAETLVILLHGYGADGNDLIGLAPHWQQVLRTTAFVAPNAPERCAMSPMGYQWFPITRLDPNEMWTGVQSAAETLNAFIDQELDRHGLDESKLVLAGFSQGTMMALHVGLRRAKTPAGILGFSGALAGGEHLAGEITAKPPVLLVHGDADEVVTIDRMHAAVQTLGDVGLQVQWHVSRGIGHGIAPDGMALGVRFLRDVFSAPTQIAE